MVTAMAAVKVAVVAAVLLVGFAGVRPAEAAVTVTLTANDYTPGYCGDVLLTVSVTELDTVTKDIHIYRVTGGGTHISVTSFTSQPAATNEWTHWVNHGCPSSTISYKARATYNTPATDTDSEVIGVSWNQPPEVEIDADQFLVGLCESVEITAAFRTGAGGRQESLLRNGNLYEVDESGEDDPLDDASTRGSTLNIGETIKHCKPGSHLYHVRFFVYSALFGEYWTDLISVEWRHPSDLALLKEFDGQNIFTSDAPVITGLDGTDAPPGPGEAPGSTVNLKWTPLRNISRYAVQYWPSADPGSAQEILTTSTSDTLAARRSILIPDLFPDDFTQVAYTFQVRGVFTNDSTVALTLETPSGPILMEPGDSAQTPYSEPATVVLQLGGISRPIDTTTPGDAGVVESGAAVEGINDIALMIAEKTGMGSGAANTLLPFLALLAAGVATAVVVVPLGFSPLSLFAGFLVFTLVWSIGGPAWFGIPIPMAVLFPVLLAACGVMIVRGRGIFG